MPEPTPINHGIFDQSVKMREQRLLTRLCDEPLCPSTEVLWIVTAPKQEWRNAAVSENYCEAHRAEAERRIAELDYEAGVATGRIRMQ